MLNRILESLDLPLIPEGTVKGKHLAYINIENKFKEEGVDYFVGNWFRHLNSMPNLTKAYQETGLNLDNIYNLAVLCTYTERYGVPESPWFKKMVTELANGCEFSLAAGNLAFYKCLIDKTHRKKKGKYLDRNRLMNAAEECGMKTFNRKAEFIRKVCAQGLIKRVRRENFVFSSEEIRQVFYRTSYNWKLDEQDYIDSSYRCRMNIIIPLWRKLIPSDYLGDFNA